MIRLDAFQLRQLEEKRARGVMKEVKRRPMYFILENIYDTYNIGGLFRLADALAIKKIYICGESEIPPNHRIKKASIGTYKVVPWEYCKTAVEAINKLKKQIKEIKIIAVEQDKSSVPFTTIDYQYPVALILGNETSGITKETLSLADHIAEIPMWGINKSLNVIVSAAIVSYWIVKNEELNP